MGRKLQCHKGNFLVISQVHCARKYIQHRLVDLFHYTRNKYRLHLVEVVGVISVEMTFTIAFAYLEGGKFYHIVWVFKKLKGIIMKSDVMPQVKLT